MNKRSFALLPAVFFIFFAFNSCTSSHTSTGGSPSVFSAQLIKAANASDLEKRLKDELIRRYEHFYSYYLYYGGLIVSTGMTSDPLGGGTTPVAATPTSGTAAADSSSSDTSHSDTNIQEKGVDEGDLVKTDGEYIYLARGTHFFILKANPADETALISDIDLKQPINELYLSGTGTLVSLITTSYYSYPLMTTVSPASFQKTQVRTGRFSSAPKTRAAASSPVLVNATGPITRVYNYDVSAPTAPVLMATFDFPGFSQGSRRINNTLYIVTDYTIDLPNPVSPWDYLTGGSYDEETFKNACDAAIAENIRRIDALTLDQLLPVYTATPYSAGAAGTSSTGPAVGYADVYIPQSGNGTDLALVISLDLSQPENRVDSSAVLTSWGGIYMSPESLYLTSDNNWRWIEPLENAEPPEGNPEPQTAVHKFSISSTTGKPVYRGTGVVDGWVNNRFSMSDYQGYLRIGTTRGGWWAEAISNQLGVLSEENGELVSRGTLTGIAPGESIYSMRFDGNRGYMVTFHRTDPLFTFDLSDPSNPRPAGAITDISGFATYMHLIGSDRLLTIGESTNDAGQVIGNKLQLFDVSNLAAPRLLDGYELGPGWSSALYDPHAFLYYDPLKILTVPYYSYSYDTTVNGYYSYNYISGLKVFDIGPQSITPHGSGMITAPTITTDYAYSYQDTVDRSVIIGNDIFAVAHRSVTVANADELDVHLQEVALPESYYFYPMMSTGTSGGGSVLTLVSSTLGTTPTGSLQPIIMTKTMTQQSTGSQKRPAVKR